MNKPMVGVRSYTEPAEPHRLQTFFLDEANEAAYADQLQRLLVAGRLDEAEAMLAADLAGFDGDLARLCQRLRPEDVTIAGWEDLIPVLEDYEGPPITALTIGLTNDNDLEFAGKEHEPVVLVGLYSDDAYPFSTRAPAELLAECAAEDAGWAGQEEDIELYLDIHGLGPLNSALVTHKHRHFLRDPGTARAPGAYVEYVLGCWLRALRFLQALQRAADAHGLPAGAVLLAGLSGMKTDLATIIDTANRTRIAARPQHSAPTLTYKPYVRKSELPEVTTQGSSFREQVAEIVEAAPAPQGFWARLKARLAGR